MSHRPAHPTHFLLVEDDAAHADLIRLALEGHRVDISFAHVSDGEQALAYVRREPPFQDAPRPDVVLLDLGLPRMSGHEVLETIKTDPALATIAVAILTTSDDERDLERAYRGRANSFMRKPLDFVRFQSLVREIGLYWTVWNEPSPPALSAPSSP